MVQYPFSVVLCNLKRSFIIVSFLVADLTPKNGTAGERSGAWSAQTSGPRESGHVKNASKHALMSMF